MSNPVIDTCGNQIWRNHKGDIHREDGPAIIWANGTQVWWINNNRHRIDGPAIIYPNGSQEWFINDKRYFNIQSFREAANLSDEDMLMIKIKYGNVK